jgi:hypothetical protein
MAPRHSLALVGLLYAEAKVHVKTESQIVAGLDDQTRRLLEAMPAEVRREAIAFLREAVPIVNEGMTEFLNRLDAVMERRVNGLVCSGQGLARGLGEELTGAWKNERPKPLLELTQEFDSRHNFAGQTARYITTSYFDYLHNAAITSCQLADSDAKNRAEKLRIDARQRMRVWESIESTCSTPSDCLTKQYAAVDTLIKSADPRDIGAADAQQNFRLVNLVTPKQGFISWASSLFGHHEWTTQEAAWVQYETELIKLQSIRRGLEIARNLRVTIAKERLTEVLLALGNAETALVAIKRKIGTISVSENNQSSVEAIALLKAKSDWNIALEEAINGDSSLKSSATNGQERIKKLESEISNISNTIKLNNEAIAANDAERRRKAELRRAEWEDRMTRRAPK